MRYSIAGFGGWYLIDTTLNRWWNMTWGCDSYFAARCHPPVLNDKHYDVMSVTRQSNEPLLSLNSTVKTWAGVCQRGFCHNTHVCPFELRQSRDFFPLIRTWSFWVAQEHACQYILAKSVYWIHSNVQSISKITVEVKTTYSKRGAFDETLNFANYTLFYSWHI